MVLCNKIMNAPIIVCILKNELDFGFHLVTDIIVLGFSSQYIYYESTLENFSVTHLFICKMEIVTVYLMHIWGEF